MIKFILLLTFTLILNADYKAKQVTSTDLKSLNSIDRKLYELAFEKETYSFNEVSLFIYRNLAYKLDYTLLKVTGTTSARATYNASQNPFTNEGSRVRGQVVLTYPFYDAKESNARLEKMVTTKQKIISQVKKYFTLKAKYKDLQTEKLILTSIETREKARKLQAVGSFNEWLKVIRDIKKVNIDLSLSEIELSEAKQILLSYIKKSKRKLLKAML